MKQYRRDAKKHMSDEEYEAYKAKKRRDPQICRGGKPHDYVLVLPYHVSYTSEYKFNPEEYYRLCDELTAQMIENREKIKAMGVTSRYGNWRERKETRYYMCSVCKKQKHEYPE